MTGVDEAAHEAQPGVGLRRQVAAGHRLGQPRAAAREHPVDEEGDASATATETRAEIQRARSLTVQLCRAMGSRGMGGARLRRAVLLDALGTLLRLEPPAPRLRAALARPRGGGRRVRGRGAIRAEIGFYRRTCTRAATRRRSPRCAELRGGRCARRCGRGRARSRAPADARRCWTRWSSPPTPTPRPRSRRCARSGRARRRVQLGRLARTSASRRPGLAPLVDAAVASAVFGAAKPERAIFEHALALAGAAPRPLARRRHLDVDVAGARAAGCARCWSRATDARGAPRGRARSARPRGAARRWRRALGLSPQ